jgi:galactokinase
MTPPEERRFFVPGRIEVLGKHTDYGGGRSLLATVNRGFEIVSSPIDGSVVTVVDLVRGESVSFDFDAEIVPRPGHWSLYPMTVASRIARDFPRARHGVRISISSDLPPDAGMSSSSAFIVGTWLALAAWNDLENVGFSSRDLSNPLDLATYLASVEAGVGTEGGSEDHTAILCSSVDTITRFSFCPPRREGRVRLPRDLVFAIAHSGVVARKTGDARERYNRCSRLARAIVDTWNLSQGDNATTLLEILRRSSHALEATRRALSDTAHSAFSAEELIARLEHFAEESEQIVPAAFDALERGDLAAFGEEVDRSQKLGHSKLGNQIPETIVLANLAREHGARAASAFGAGFGGSVWALIEERHAPEFLRSWERTYREQFPDRADFAVFFSTPACAAAHEIT